MREVFGTGSDDGGAVTTATPPAARARTPAASHAAVQRLVEEQMALTRGAASGRGGVDGSWVSAPYDVVHGAPPQAGVVDSASHTAATSPAAATAASAACVTVHVHYHFHGAVPTGKEALHTHSYVYLR